MPVSGATPDTITVFPEAVTAERLRSNPESHGQIEDFNFLFAVPATYATNFLAYS